MALTAYCKKCAREVEAGENCPYCGAKLGAENKRTVSKEAEEWIQKALKVTSLPERKKIDKEWC